MAKKIGLAGKYKKLGLLYWEQHSTDKHLFIEGIIRGWPSEDWNKRIGDPILYRFTWAALLGSTKAVDLTLWVMKSDKTEVRLEKK
jgi:hypothetical protein